MNLNEEVRNGYTITAQMKKLWEKELLVFEKLYEVCNKYDLKVVATGGTCIGAVREHGFIPWDDDIDVEMLRPDFEKLVSIAEKEFKYPFFLQCSRTEDNYPNGHAQLRLSGTTAILKGDYRKINHGIYVDIFILDAIPKDENKLTQMKKKSTLIKKRLNGYSYCTLPHLLGKNFLSLLFDYLYVKIKGYDRLNKEYEDIFRSNKIEDCEEVASMMFRWDQIPRVRRSKHMMDKIILMPFEDILMPVPAMYDEILTNHFGDYMTPHKIPAFHDGYYMLDTNRDYSYYLPLMKRDLLKEKIHRLFHGGK